MKKLQNLLSGFLHQKTSARKRNSTTGSSKTLIKNNGTKSTKILANLSTQNSNRKSHHTDQNWTANVEKYSDYLTQQETVQDSDTFVSKSWKRSARNTSNTRADKDMERQDRIDGMVQALNEKLRDRKVNIGGISKKEFNNGGSYISALNSRKRSSK